MGEQAGEFVEPAFEQHLDRLRHAPMDDAPVFRKNAAVGGFVH